MSFIKWFIFDKLGLWMNLESWEKKRFLMSFVRLAKYFSSFIDLFLRTLLIEDFLHSIKRNPLLG
jgi:hypothetical protein